MATTSSGRVSRGLRMAQERYDVPMTKREAMALLNLIAACYSDGKMKPEAREIEIGNFLADRIIRIINGEPIDGAS